MSESLGLKKLEMVVIWFFNMSLVELISASSDLGKSFPIKPSKGIFISYFTVWNLTLNCLSWICKEISKLPMV